MFDLSQLNTGDVLLFSTQWSWNPISWFAKTIEYFTESPYSHVGIVLRDPIWISAKLKGLYLWESTYQGTPDQEDGKIKLGVQITLIDDIMKEKNEIIYWRKINCPNDKLTIYNLMNVEDIVYDKPYDIMPQDWIEAYMRKDADPQRTNRMFCSALASYIYTKCKILKDDTDWSIVRPSDFAPENDGKFIHFQQQCFLGDMKIIKP